MGGEGGKPEAELQVLHIRGMRGRIQRKCSQRLNDGEPQWQRAETLGALINGVFLVALCLSIFLEAVSRFVEPQVVSNPKLVLIVGSFGLASNMLGLFLFHEHEHGHSHDGESVDRNAHDGDLEAAKGAQGPHAAGSRRGYGATTADESGNVVDVLPQGNIGAWPRTSFPGDETSAPRDDGHTTNSQRFTNSDEDALTAAENMSPAPLRKASSNGSRRQRRRASGSRTRHASVEDMHVYPASFRHDIIAASKLEEIESATESEGDSAAEDDVRAPDERTPLVMPVGSPSAGKRAAPQGRSLSMGHSEHRHRLPKDPGEKGGHSHGDLNMRGVFLHVFGDALGNVGVIASALFIWLTDFWWRYYTDPAISLVITVIILASAIPLCAAASRILLQAVPADLNVDDIAADIQDLPGVVGCHHLHVWQLSNTKLVASLHIQVSFDFEGEGSARYMELARAVRTCLHEYGIHSSTIQPEFCLDEGHNHTDPADRGLGDHGPENVAAPKMASRDVSRQPSVRSMGDGCLLECDEGCGTRKRCCAPSGTTATAPSSSHGSGDAH
jgi:solute carrier family 30 (zinc transporter), member 1